MIRRIAALALLMCLVTSMALAATTPTPPPLDITQEVMQPPEMIRNVLNIAYNEWETLAGSTLKKVNKYTEWRGKGVGFGWCGGFITWCMLEAGVPMEELEAFKTAAKGTEDGFALMEGVHHVKEASVGKLLRGYQIMNRSTNVPQPGYLLVYGCSYNKTIHIGLVYDVQPLGNGKFRLTTLEGNMSNRVKMYVHDYDMYAENQEANLSLVPEEERTREETAEFNYAIPSSTPNGGSSGKKYNYYVNCFLMPWVPGDPVNASTTPTPAK